MSLPSRRIADPRRGDSAWSIRPPHELVPVPDTTAVEEPVEPSLGAADEVA